MQLSRKLQDARPRQMRFGGSWKHQRRGRRLSFEEQRTRRWQGRRLRPRQCAARPTPPWQGPMLRGRKQKRRWHGQPQKRRLRGRLQTPRSLLRKRGAKAWKSKSSLPKHASSSPRRRLRMRGKRPRRGSRWSKQQPLKLQRRRPRQTCEHKHRKRSPSRRRRLKFTGGRRKPHLWKRRRS